MHAKLVLWADAGLQAAELGWQGWWARSWPNEARLYGGWASFQKFAWAPRGLAAPSLAQLAWVRLLLGLPLSCLFESARVALAGPGAIFCCGRQLVAIACLRPCLLASSSLLIYCFLCVGSWRSCFLMFLRFAFLFHCVLASLPLAFLLVASCFLLFVVSLS